MYTRKRCLWSLSVCCIITGFRLQDSYFPSLFCYSFQDKAFSVLSSTNKYTLLFLSFPDSLLFGGGVWERRGGTLRLFLRGGWNSTNFVTDEEVEGNWNGRVKNQSGTQAITSLTTMILHLEVAPPAKASPTTALCPPVHHIFPTSSFLKIWNLHKSPGHSSRRSCSSLLFLGQQTKSSLGPYYSKQNTFCLRHSWRKMIMVS